MLFGPNIRYFNELEINGKNVDDKDDYTTEEPEVDEDETVDDADETVEDTTEDTDDLTDFTEDEFDGGDDEGNEEPATDEPVEDEEPAEDTIEEEPEATNDLEDFTEDEFDGGDDEGDTEPESDEGAGEDTGSEGDEGSDDVTDFTQDEFDDGGDEGGSTDDTADSGGDEGTDEGEGDDSGEESNDTGDTDNTLAGMEKNLFSDLSPQQLAIKNNELLRNYIELYETINTIFDSINKIPKTYDNTRPLTFITDQLVSLKDMVNYIITTTYITRTYVENMTYYKQALVILEQINTMLKALIQKPAKKD
jgi:hypothetical protein